MYALRWQATHPGTFGFSVIGLSGQATLVRALPGEYLERLILSNRILDDDIQLMGVVREPMGLAIVTKQPTIVGSAATREEMIAYFEARRFSHLPEYCAGYRGSLSFYRDLDDIAVFDAHPANFLKDRAGVLFAIDAIVVRVEGDLEKIIHELR